MANVINNSPDTYVKFHNSFGGDILYIELLLNVYIVIELYCGPLNVLLLPG